MSAETKHVLDGIFETEPFPTLLGGYCAPCGRKFFPSRPVCPVCLTPMDKVRLSGEGTIYSFTVVRTKPPFGLPQPYAVAYIDLKEEKLRVFGLLDAGRIDWYKVGAEVSLSVAAIGCDRNGLPCLRYFFSAKEGGE